MYVYSLDMIELDMDLVKAKTIIKSLIHECEHEYVRRKGDRTIEVIDGMLEITSKYVEKLEEKVEGGGSIE